MHGSCKTKNSSKSSKFQNKTGTYYILHSLKHLTYHLVTRTEDFPNTSLEIFRIILQIERNVTKESNIHVQRREHEKKR